MKLVKLCSLALAILLAALALGSLPPFQSQRPAPAATLTASSSPTSAPAPALPGDTITGPATVSTAFINSLLCGYRSPACGDGQTFTNNGKLYGLDPVWPLAIFFNESNFGRAGEARASRSIGNLRCLDWQHYGDLHTWCQDGYAWFPDWQAGIAACFRLLAGPLYVAGGLVTIQQVIERFAPIGDGNNPVHYIAVVRSAVALWRAGNVQVPA